MATYKVLDFIQGL